MRRRLALLTVIATLGAACSPTAGQPDLPPSETAAAPPAGVDAARTTRVSAPQPDLGTSDIVEWQFVGTAIDAGSPVLCAGVVMTSLPPQCVGVPVIGLDWSAVDWVETAGGVRWATMRLVGTFDGERFNLTRPPEPPVLGEETPFSVPLPCEEPDGGWQIINPATADNDSPAVVYAQAQPEFMGNWVYRLPADAAVYSVKVFTFTGNLAEHEARLREIYGGALCVSLARRSLGELEGIRRQVKETLFGPEAETAGIYLANGQLGDTIDVVTGTIEIYVFAAEAGAQGWLDWQFGEGVVNIHSQLRRLGQP